MTETFERFGLGLVALAALAIAGIRYLPEFTTLRVPVGLSVDVLFVAVAIAFVGLVVAQFQTLLTPTPGRVAITSGLVVIAATMLDYAPPLAFFGGIGLLGVGALLRQAEVFEEVVR